MSYNLRLSFELYAEMRSSTRTALDKGCSPFWSPLVAGGSHCTIPGDLPVLFFYPSWFLFFTALIMVIWVKSTHSISPEPSQRGLKIKNKISFSEGFPRVSTQLVLSLPVQQISCQRQRCLDLPQSQVVSSIRGEVVLMKYSSPSFSMVLLFTVYLRSTTVKKKTLNEKFWK